jgi:predicted ATP-grasp superfamily ATP-dependent carboligase
MINRVLVTDGDQRAALAVVRSLGAGGADVYVTGPRPRTLAGASRFSCAQIALPDPLDDPDQYAADLAAIISRWKINALIPITEASLLAVLQFPEQFRGVVLPFPDLHRFRQVSDKSLVMKHATAVGIATPSQRLLAVPEGISRLETEDLHFPLVIKPARSVAEGPDGRIKTGVRYAASRTELIARLKEFSSQAYPLLLQQRIVGPGVGVFLLLWDGELVAACAHRRLREKPPAGGVSVYRESVALDPSLRDRSRALLESFDWEGVAMVEYKIDEATGTPFLMEINGRLWGSLQLAIDAGVNFPMLMLEAASGRHPNPVLTYRTGVRSRWWWGEVDHLLARFTRSNASLALPPGAPTRCRALRDFLRFGRPEDRNEILRLSDPVPFVRETIDWFRDL